MKLFALFLMSVRWMLTLFFLYKVAQTAGYWTSFVLLLIAIRFNIQDAMAEKTLHVSSPLAQSLLKTWREEQAEAEKNGR